MALIFDNPSATSNVLGSQYNLLHTIPIDVTITETHSLKQTITDKPVEGGATISDNIILLPSTVKIKGILAGDILSGDTLGDKFNSLKSLRKTREPFTLTTSLDIYRNMFFDGEIVINRDSSNIRAVVFDTVLKQVNIIESLTTTVPPESVAAENDKKGKRSRSGKKQSGKKSAKEVSASKKEQEKSWIVGLLG